MSIVDKKEVTVNGNKQIEAVLLRASVDKLGQIQDEIAEYNPDQKTRDVQAMILKHFVLGTTNMYTPRVEFNDLSLVLRDQQSQMAFNTYQPNNGEAWEGDQQNAWRSRAIRPVVRNKCMSIAAHATARLIFPKVFAFNDQSEDQTDAANVMEDLMEWSGDISNYPYTALMRVITAMSSPASIGYTEYGEVTRLVKREKGKDGKWIEERVRDEAYPCFMDEVVPVTQLFIENFYEPDIQKQGWLIWRKVYSFSAAQNKYNGVYDNFKYVRPGIQTIYDDANNQFYYVYDPNMREEDVEELTYWNKNLDLKIIMVNGVMMTDHDNPNPSTVFAFCSNFDISYAVCVPPEAEPCCNGSCELSLIDFSTTLSISSPLRRSEPTLIARKSAFGSVSVVTAPGTITSEAIISPPTATIGLNIARNVPSITI